MKRLIDAEKAKQLFESYGCSEDVLTLIDSIPAETDVEPVVRGQWIPLGQYTSGSGNGRNYTHYCSECGNHGYKDDKRCSNCGAQMRASNIYDNPDLVKKEDEN